MGALLGACLLLFGGFAFGRTAGRARQNAWAGPRTTGMRQRTAPGSGQRTVRQEVRLLREKAHLDNWLEHQRHHRKNGTAATPGTVAAATVPGGKPVTPLRAAAQRLTARRGGVTVIPPAAQSRPAPPPQAPPAPPNGSPGRNTTMPASGNAVEQFVEGVNQIHAEAQAGGIHAKHAAVKACHEACVRFAAMAQMLSRQMSEPGMNYGNEITEPIAKSAAQLQAAAMGFGEADAALASLENMTVGDLARSSRQAPYHTELSENGSH
jgi:hypothetical protein